MRGHSRLLSRGNLLLSVSVASFAAVRLLLKAGPRLLSGRRSAAFASAISVITGQSSRQIVGSFFLPSTYARAITVPVGRSTAPLALDMHTINSTRPTSHGSRISGKITDIVVYVVLEASWSTWTISLPIYSRSMFQVWVRVTPADFFVGRTPFSQRPRRAPLPMMVPSSLGPHPQNLYFAWSDCMFLSSQPAQGIQSPTNPVEDLVYIIDDHDWCLHLRSRLDEMCLLLSSLPKCCPNGKHARVATGIIACVQLWTWSRIFPFMLFVCSHFMTTLLARLWSDCQLEAMQSLHHPWTLGLATGRTNHASFKSYIAQDAYFLRAFAKARVALECTTWKIVAYMYCVQHASITHWNLRC